MIAWISAGRSELAGALVDDALVDDVLPAGALVVAPAPVVVDAVGAVVVVVASSGSSAHAASATPAATAIAINLRLFTMLPLGPGTASPRRRPHPGSRGDQRSSSAITRSVGRPITARPPLTITGRCINSGWASRTRHDAVDGGHVVGRHAELGPALAAHEIGRRILELIEDRAQRGLVRRRVQVAHDVHVDAELLGRLQRLPGLRAAWVVVDRRLGHGRPP